VAQAKQLIAHQWQSHDAKGQRLQRFVQYKLLDRLKITGNRNFYCIRHGFETIPGEYQDQVAVDSVMVHRAAEI
jgi:hypothetical protein